MTTYGQEISWTQFDGTRQSVKSDGFKTQQLAKWKTIEEAKMGGKRRKHPNKEIILIQYLYNSPTFALLSNPLPLYCKQ